MRYMVKICYGAGTLVIFLLFFIGSPAGAASMLDGLSSFQESLAGWMEKVENLDERLSIMEKDLEGKGKQLTDITASLSNIESLLSKLDSKITKVQNMRTVEGVRESLKSYEDALNIFKERFAEMAKKLEDQDVKVAVLEKVYATAQNPVETLLREMNEHKESINVLTEKMDTQDKSLMVIMEGFKKKETPSEELGKRLDELQTRISELEGGTVTRKKDTVAAETHGTETAKETKHPETHEVETEEHMVSVREKTEGEHKVSHAGEKGHLEGAGTEKTVSAEMKGYVDIGQGFFVKDVEFVSFGSSCQVRGEIVNKSDRYFSTADFTIQTFNNVGRMLGGHSFSIIGFGQERKETFEEIITGVNEGEITNYAMAFGAGEMKMAERIHEAVIAESEAQTDHHKVAVKEKALEGFEDIGNGFYVGNVAFSGFGSSSSVTGEIKNQSEKNFERAAFVIKLFSREYGMITKLDFSVRGIKSGESRHFEEIVAGVGPTDIDRYEVSFKESY